MKIKKNTVCLTSERGHNNFLYPSVGKVLVKEDCVVDRISWLSGGNKHIPIKILKSNLILLDIEGSTIKNISPPQKDGYAVVWINK